MPSFHTDTVAGILGERQGLQRLQLADGSRAYALTDLTGDVVVGDRVVVNTTAVDLGLGSGGWHAVLWNLARDEWAQAGGGHIMKLRYTPLQTDTGAAEEHNSADSDGAAGIGDLRGMPVVVGTLHSQLPGIAVAAKAERPEATIAYVMTDGGALPLVLSDLVWALRDKGLVAATITAGHAFGGDLEAVNTASALQLARNQVGADLTIVAMGPGVVGTGTRLGTTALEAAPALDLAAALGGLPVYCVRMSSADDRERHRGLSHHARTVLTLVRSAVQVPLPPNLAQNASDPELARHRVVEVDGPDIGSLFMSHDLEVTTMGRSVDDEPEFFAVTASCGMHAARLVHP